MWIECQGRSERGVLGMEGHERGREGGEEVGEEKQEKTNVF